MGKGTISLKTLPIKSKIYGNSDFYFRPIFQTEYNGQLYYYFALRPSSEKGYLFEIEGEFGIGHLSFLSEKHDIDKGVYSNVFYGYYKEDLQNMTYYQKSKILKWATDGIIHMNMAIKKKGE